MLGMNTTRRSALVALTALPLWPAGCALQPLADLPITPLPEPATPRVLRAPALGQSWSYKQLNRFNGEQVDTLRETVAAVAERTVVRRTGANGVVLPDEVHAAWGWLLRDPVWDMPLNLQAGLPLWPRRLQVGAREQLQTRYLLDGGSYRYWIDLYCVAKAWERVQVPAGTFDCLRVERLIHLEHQDPTRLETERRDTLWLAPEVGRWVARETTGDYRVASHHRDDWRWPWPMVSMDNWRREDRWRWELLAWT
jgi:hypothetical protein